MSEKIIPFKREEHKSERLRQMNYSVHGFWGGDNVHVSQSRLFSKEGKWGDPEVSWSCGGRDGKEPDGILAAECFGKAIADAVIVARQWRDEHAAKKSTNKSTRR